MMKSVQAVCAAQTPARPMIHNTNNAKAATRNK